MKRCLFCILIIVLAPLSVFAVTSRGVEYSVFNPQNSASSPFAKDFFAYADFNACFGLPKSNPKFREFKAEGVVSSRNLSLLASVSNMLKDSSTITNGTDYITKFDFDFFASLKISKKSSIGFKWNLGIEKLQEPVNNYINFFNLLYCISTMHNNTGNLYSKSSFSLYGAYYNTDTLSFSVFLEDFLFLDTNELIFSSESIIDSFGFNITSSMPRYDKIGTLRMFQLLVKLDCLNIFVEPIIEPTAEFRINVGLDKAFAISDKFSFDLNKFNEAPFLAQTSNTFELSLTSNKYSFGIGIMSPLSFSTNDGEFSGFIKFRFMGE